MIARTAAGRKFIACDPSCAESFREDRAAGLNYGLHKRPTGGFYMDREEWSRDQTACAYCGDAVPLTEEIPADVPQS